VLFLLSWRRLSLAGGDGFAAGPPERQAAAADEGLVVGVTTADGVAAAAAGTPSVAGTAAAPSTTGGPEPTRSAGQWSRLVSRAALPKRVLPPRVK